MRTINPHRTLYASVTYVDEMDIHCNIAELKPSIANENVSTIARTSRKSELSPTTRTRERDRNSDHKATTNPILNTTPTLHKVMVTTLISRITETQISTIRIITTRVPLIKDRISELGIKITTSLQGKMTFPMLSITKIFFRTILMHSLTTCSS